MPPQILYVRPGERPIEEGWYVVRPPHSTSNIIVHSDGVGAEFRGRRYGGRDPLIDHTFVARIFPDRIFAEGAVESNQTDAIVQMPPAGTIGDHPHIDRWKVHSSQYVLNNRWLSVRADNCEIASGARINPYYVVESADFVHAIATDIKGDLILVRQYRHGMAGVSLELPGGLMDPDEIDPIVTARRELEEETGYTGGHATRFLSLSPDPARYANQVHFVRTTGVIPGKARPESTEAIEVVIVGQKEAIELALNGNIKHAAHVSAIIAAFFKET